MANQKIWTRNYYNLFAALYGGLGTDATEPSESRPMVRIPDGSYVKLGSDITRLAFGMITSLNKISGYLGDENQNINESDRYNGNYIIQYKSPWKINLGSGRNSPTYEDYKLQNPIINDMRVNNVKALNTSYDSNTHEYTFGYKVPIIYTGATEIEVGEFGLYVPALTEFDRYGAIGKATLVYHEVFETPYILNENDVLEIIITQTAIHPNYVPYPIN